jgi:hypothetical protein
VSSAVLTSGLFVRVEAFFPWTCVAVEKCAPGHGSFPSKAPWQCVALRALSTADLLFNKNQQHS